MTHVIASYDDAEWQLVPKALSRGMRLPLLRSFDSDSKWKMVLAAAPQLGKGYVVPAAAPVDTSHRPVAWQVQASSGEWAFIESDELNEYKNSNLRSLGITATFAQGKRTS